MKNLKLDETLVATVISEMKGKKAEKFLNSVKIINDSLDLGGWLKGLSRSAESGFHQGSGIRVDKTRETYKDKALSELYFSLQYGHGVKDVDASAAKITKEELKKHTLGFVKAWMTLCNQKTNAIKELDASRPLPVKTEVGLSPKVTKTLTEMNLDLDLNSVKMAELDFIWVNKRSLTTGEVMLDRQGLPIKEKEYFVKWSDGIIHGQSRFHASIGECEACGKRIPSGRFVPVEAQDRKKNQLISLWLGCDCAKNIFGIQDVGLSRK